MYGYRIYTRGEGLLVGGEYAAGIDKLDEVRDLWLDLPLYQAEYGYGCGLAVANGASECLGAGIAAYQRALEQEPQHAVWWANLGALYWSGEQAEAALAALQQATHYAPEASDLWLNLGQYYEALGDDEYARLAYAQALEADEDWAYIRFWDETALRERVLAESGIGASPYQRALALWDSGDHVGAVGVLEATIDHDPSQPRPYAQLARLHIAGGEVSRAREYLDAARLLAHTAHDDVWNVVVEAELARAEGDRVRYTALLEDARSMMWPDDTGHRVMYGLDVAYLQFWRVRVGGVLLPQLTVYGPDPELVDILLRVDASVP